MVILYCPLSPYGYLLLSAITIWLPVIVRYHPMVTRYCLLPPYGYPVLFAVTLWLSVIVPGTL